MNNHWNISTIGWKNSEKNLAGGIDAFIASFKKSLTTTPTFVVNLKPQDREQGELEITDPTVASQKIDDFIASFRQELASWELRKKS